MRSLAESGVRVESARYRKSHSLAKSISSVSWFTLAETHADRAASTGFVISMLFLAVTAIYAFSLSGAAKPLLAEAAALADRAAFDAGFRLENIVLSGSQYAPRAGLLDAAGWPYRGSSLFYDAKEARRRLLESGWIETAEVRRILPSRLEVAVTERMPFARWEDAGRKIYVMDRDGRLLGPDDQGRFNALPLYVGIGAPQEAQGFEEALQGSEALKARIERVELVAERFWTVKLGNGPMLKLPHKVTPLVLERLDSLLANPKVAGLSLETIDLRLSNRTILQLLEPTVANRDKAIAALTSVPAQALSASGKGKAL